MQFDCCPRLLGQYRDSWDFQTLQAWWRLQPDCFVLVQRCVPLVHFKRSLGILREIPGSLGSTIHCWWNFLMLLRPETIFCRNFHDLRICHSFPDFALLLCFIPQRWYWRLGRVDCLDLCRTNWSYRGCHYGQTSKSWSCNSCWMGWFHAWSSPKWNSTLQGLKWGSLLVCWYCMCYSLCSANSFHIQSRSYQLYFLYGSLFLLERNLTLRRWLP